MFPFLLQMIEEDDIGAFKSYLNEHPVYTIDSSGYNILYYLCKWNASLEFLQECIDRGVNIHIQDDMGENLLIFNCKRNKIKYMQLLIEYGININHTDINLDTAFLWAAYYNRIPILELLMDYQVDYTHCYKDGKNAIMWALKQQNIDAFEWLMPYFPNINQIDNYGNSIMNMYKSFSFKKILYNHILYYKWIIITYFNHFHFHPLLEYNLLHEIFSYYTTKTNFI